MQERPRAAALVALVLLLLSAIAGAQAQAPTFQPQLRVIPDIRLAPRDLSAPGRFAPLTLNQTDQSRHMAMRTGRLNFGCGPIYCVCRGDLDCNDMFTTNVCGDRAVCIGQFCYCDRSRLRLAP